MLPKRRIVIGLALLGVFLAAVVVSCRDTRLNRAIRDRNTKTIDRMLDKEVDVNAIGAGGRTALHAAIEAGDKETYMKLLEHHADPNICDNAGTSVVHLAAEQEDVYWLREALQHGGNPNQQNTGNPYSPDSTPIFYAIDARRTENVLELIRAGADVNHKDSHGMRPLRTAMGAQMYEAMIAMIEAGADPMAKNGIDQDTTIFDIWGFDNKFEKFIKDEKNKIWYRKLLVILDERGRLEK